MCIRTSEQNNVEGVLRQGNMKNATTSVVEGAIVAWLLDTKWNVKRSSTPVIHISQTWANGTLIQDVDLHTVEWNRDIFDVAQLRLFENTFPSSHLSSFCMFGFVRTFVNLSTISEHSLYSTIRHLLNNSE